MKLVNGSCVSGKAFHTPVPRLVSSPSHYFPLFLRLRTRLVLRRSSRLLDRPAPSDAFSLSFFLVVPLPRGLLAKENPRTDASFSPRDLSFSHFFPSSHGVGSSRQVNAKVAVRCKSLAFPAWFALLEYLSRERALSSLLHRVRLRRSRRALAWT